MSELTLHKGQERVLDSNARFIGAVSGIQGGKTTVGAIWLNREIYKLYAEGNKGDFLIGAPTVKILQQSTLPKYQAFFPSDWGRWREAKQCFELAWDHPTERRPCRIYVRSTENPDHLEGMTVLRAWLDEVGQMKEAAWVNVQGRLSINKGRCVMTTTPYAMNWFFREIFKKAPTNPDIEVVTWTSSDNPAFPKEELERMRQSLPPAIFERRYLGKFTKLEGLVYPDFDPDRHVIDPFQIPDSWTKFAGLDFGHSVETAVVCIAEDSSTNTFFVYKEFFKAETLLREISNFLHNEHLQFVMADSQGAQNIAELQRYYGNRNVKSVDKTRNDIGKERILTLLKEGRIKFFRGRAAHTIDEIEEYHYRPPTSDNVDGPDKPMKKNDHCMDALRYAFSQITTGVYPVRAQQRLTIKDRVKRRVSNANANRDPWTGY